MRFTFSAFRRPFRMIMMLIMAVGLSSLNPLCTQDPFAAGVRPTEPLTPEQELAALQVPDGFQVQLIAAEPDIFKPMNLAFDERGRLWVTDSLEYPWAAPLDKPARDSVKILEDTDGDGRADKIVTFADGLNIPIGVYPYPTRRDPKSGKTYSGAIVFSIPFIWDLRDHDGDDKCDERIKLYGPMGFERDTHGMCNAFRRGTDGWIYSCHGFNNETTVSGRDGHVVKMQSGNTFRFRPDGSRIEHYTRGQVNPFGMCLDPLFNLFTADCHTKPVTQLLRGGYYQSFGKPHDGLGFVPEIMQHTHGTTANCGIVAYHGGHFPDEWTGRFFTGNVMTSRVNVDTPELHGSTILAKEAPDFVTSKDPWFRPVDLQCGPDGALYIADFYNKIIGHYEVDLKHPGRDRHRGRLWRVIHKERPRTKMSDLRQSSPLDLVALLGSPNQTIRLLASARLAQDWQDRSADRIGLKDVSHEEWSRAVAEGFASANPLRRSLSLNLLTISGVKPEQLEAAQKDSHPAVRISALRRHLEEPTPLSPHQRETVCRALTDDDSFVRRTAADVLERHPAAENVSALLAALEATPADDNHLSYMIRRALRSSLELKDVLPRVMSDIKTEAASRQLASIALAITSSDAADMLVQHLQTFSEPPATTLQMVQHATRHRMSRDSSDLVKIIQTAFVDDLPRQRELLTAMKGSFDQRGEQPDTMLRKWAAELAAKLLESSRGESLSWVNEPVAGKPKPDNPWMLRQRTSQDGDKVSIFFDSLVKGEQLTGLYRSSPFVLPPRLTFWSAGHNGMPGKQPFEPKNFVRLRDAESGALLREAQPPRNDTAQKIEWDLKEFVSKDGPPRRGYLELLDADEGSAYAWMAVGRFSLAELNPSHQAEQQQAAADLVSRFRLEGLRPQMAERLMATSTNAVSREAFARALMDLAPEPVLGALVPLLGDASHSETLRQQLAAAISGPADKRDSIQIMKLLDEAARTLPERWQVRIAESLASTAEGTEALLGLVRRGHISPRLLIQPAVKQRLDAQTKPALRESIVSLTKDLPDESDSLRKLIEVRRTGYQTVVSKQDATVAAKVLELGAALFTKHCVACHQLGGKGALVGPQLDGIGQRGLDRVLEDVLDPNRNVDVNFRTTTIVMKDGKIHSGLVRREEGATLIVVDNKGKEFTVPLAEIDERVRSPLSLMPANVVELLNEQEFYDLTQFLLSQRTKRETTEK